MSIPDIEPLRDELAARRQRLIEEQEKQEERHQGDGSTTAIWAQVEPKLRRNVVKDCREDLDDIDVIGDLLQLLAEWRRKELDDWEFMTNESPRENERKSIKRAEIRIWIDKLEDLIPAEEFPTCGLCESHKMPKSDRRRRKDYRWECPDCGI